MTNLGYKQSQGDHTLLVRHSRSRGMTALLVYGDDITVTSNNEGEMNNSKRCLLKELDIKELGKLNYFLGIEVVHSKQGIFISQQNTSLLKEIGMSGCREVDLFGAHKTGYCICGKCCQPIHAQC